MRIDVKLVLSNFCSRHLVEGCLTIETGMLFAQETLQLIFSIERAEVLFAQAALQFSFKTAATSSTSLLYIE